MRARAIIRAPVAVGPCQHTHLVLPTRKLDFVHNGADPSQDQETKDGHTQAQHGGN